MLENFDFYIEGVFATPPSLVKNPESVCTSLPIPFDAKQVTLSQYDRVCKDVITAHNIADYRRQQFSLMLLPHVDIWLDYFLEGVELHR